jgi:triosephosphate isomerase
MKEICCFMNKILIIANWKCNPQSIKDADRFYGAIAENVQDADKVEIIICAPAVYLGLLRPSFDANKKKRTGKIELGAQNCFWEQSGPYTGEVSPSMLKSINCEYVILGHSERRKVFNETDEVVNRKLKAALSARLKPVLCIGEKEEEKDQIKQILENQLAGCLRDIGQGQISSIIFVYEPVWAISTSGDQFCSPDYAFSASLLMRNFLVEHYGKYVGNKARIIYGGSVDAKERSAVMYIKEAKMDGVLVGAASLKIDEFGKIIKSVFSL